MPGDILSPLTKELATNIDHFYEIKKLMHREVEWLV